MVSMYNSLNDFEIQEISNAWKGINVKIESSIKKRIPDKKSLRKCIVLEFKKDPEGNVGFFLEDSITKETFFIYNPKELKK